MYQTPAATTAARRSNRSRILQRVHIGGRDARRAEAEDLFPTALARVCSGQRTGRKEGRKEMTPIIRWCSVRVRCLTHTCRVLYVEMSRPISRKRNMAPCRCSYIISPTGWSEYSVRYRSRKNSTMLLSSGGIFKSYDRAKPRWKDLQIFNYRKRSARTYTFPICSAQHFNSSTYTY